MAKNKILSYDPHLKELARKLRKNSTLSEVLLWREVKGKKFGVEFHRQVPISHYIVDFFCHELMLVIEIDGCSHRLPEAGEKDEKRQRELEKLGIHFLRFQDKDVRNDMHRVLEQIAYGVTLRAEHPPVSR